MIFAKTKFSHNIRTPKGLSTRSGTETRVFKNAGENKRKRRPLPPHGALAYGNSRFCIVKFTKPAYGRDPQVPALAANTPTPL